MLRPLHKAFKLDSLRVAPVTGLKTSYISVNCQLCLRVNVLDVGVFTCSPTQDSEQEDLSQWPI